MSKYKYYRQVDADDSHAHLANSFGERHGRNDRMAGDGEVTVEACHGRCDVILMIDDSLFDLGEMIVNMDVKGSHWQQTEAAVEYNDAKTKALQKHVNLLIADINLGEGVPNGIQLYKDICREFRSEGQVPPLCLFVSGRRESEYAEDLACCRVWDYLDKPCNVQNLQKKINGALAALPLWTQMQGLLQQSEDWGDELERLRRYLINLECQYALISATDDEAEHWSQAELTERARLIKLGEPPVFNAYHSRMLEELQERHLKWLEDQGF